MDAHRPGVEDPPPFRSTTTSLDHNMKTAVIGLGHIGATVARNLVAGGVGVILANKTSEVADKLAKELGNKASVMPVGDAIAAADVIVLAVPYPTIQDLVTTHRAALAGKV